MKSTLDTTTIRIGRGVGDVRFGLARSDAKDLLGEPSNVIQGVEEPESEVWFYHELGLAIGFEPEYDGRLGSIEISNPAATLNGEKLIGLTIMDVALKLRAAFAFPIEAVFGDDEEVPEQLRIPELSISFWNEGIVMQSISFGVLEGREGEVFWPEDVEATEDDPVPRNSVN